jgi:RND family efflux transporter MFP subunit
MSGACLVCGRGAARWVSLLAAFGLCLAAAGCGEPPAPPAPPRPVRTVTVEKRPLGEAIVQVGEIEARYETDFGFRIDGKIIARPVEIGSVVKKGEVLARLDDQPQRNRLQAARAAVTAAEAEVTRTRSEEGRERALIQQGFATRQKYDTALRDLQTAEAQLDSARALQTLAQEKLAYSELEAEVDGVVTAIYADPGQVVAAGQRVVHIAQPGEREAVFNVPEAIFGLVPRNPAVQVTLISNPQIRTQGTVRTIAPQADPQTRTFAVRVALPEAPREMRLGTTVEGRVEMPAKAVVELPGSALFELDGKPAVWVFDTSAGTVGLRAVALLNYDAERILVSTGLEEGEVVVTAGVHLLRPGERVRQLAAAKAP